MNQLSAMQYLIDRIDLGGGKGTIKDGIYYSIAKAYQDIFDGHYESAVRRLKSTAENIEYIEKNKKDNKNLWNKLRKDIK